MRQGHNHNNPWCGRLANRNRISKILLQAQAQHHLWSRCMVSAVDQWQKSYKLMLIWRQSILKYNYRMAQTTQWPPAIPDYEECDLEHMNVPPCPTLLKLVGISAMTCRYCQTNSSLVKRPTRPEQAPCFVVSTCHIAQGSANPPTFLVIFKIHYKILANTFFLTTTAVSVAKPLPFFFCASPVFMLLSHSRYASLDT